MLGLSLVRTGLSLQGEYSLFSSAEVFPAFVSDLAEEVGAACLEELSVDPFPISLSNSSSVGDFPGLTLGL